MTTVWCADDTFLNQLIYLDDRNLVVDTPKRDQALAIKDALLADTPAAQVLSSDSEDVSLVSVFSIRTDLHDDEIEIHYKNGKEEKEVTLQLASQEKRDEVMATLREAFGDKFTEYTDNLSLPQAAYPQLMATTICGLLTWGGAGAASVLRAAQDTDVTSGQGAAGLFAMILEFLGPIGVWIVGGLVTALFALALVGQVLHPPQLVILQDRPYKPASKLMLVPKYALLLFIWYVALKIIF